MAIKKNGNQTVTRSSGNVFADLKLPNAQEKQTKVRLASAINWIIQDLQLSQAAAARRLKINQPKISAVSNYRLEGFSVERLMNFLTALDRDVDIVIRRKPKSAGVGHSLFPRGVRHKLQKERGVWVFRLGKTLTESETQDALRSIYAHRQQRNLGKDS